MVEIFEKIFKVRILGAFYALKLGILKSKLFWKQDNWRFLTWKYVSEVGNMFINLVISILFSVLPNLWYQFQLGNTSRIRNVYIFLCFQLQITMFPTSYIDRIVENFEVVKTELIVGNAFPRTADFEISTFWNLFPTLILCFQVDF